MAALRRILTMAGLSVYRTYRSPGDLMWILAMPLVLSFIISLWFGGAGGQGAEGQVAFLSPRGVQDLATYPKMRSTFGIFLIFSLAALITRAGAIHDERKAGTIARTLACGIPYREIIAAHVVAVGITGLIQAVLVLLFTGFMGHEWLAAGWSAIALPAVAATFACAGIAVGVAGFVDKEGHLQFLAGGAPSLLGMLGGAFFPLDGAPANVQRLAVVNPVYWSMQALDGGFLYQGFASQAGPLSIMLLVGVIGIVLGVQGLRRREA